MSRSWEIDKFLEPFFLTFLIFHFFFVIIVLFLYFKLYFLFQLFFTHYYFPYMSQIKLLNLLLGIIINIEYNY